MEIKKIFKEIVRIRKYNLADNPKEIMEVWRAGLNFALDEVDRFLRKNTNANRTNNKKT